MKKVEGVISDIASLLALALGLMCFTLAPEPELILGNMFIIVAGLIQWRKIKWVNK